jgi:hypothetical protein
MGALIPTAAELEMHTVVCVCASAFALGCLGGNWHRAEGESSVAAELDDKFEMDRSVMNLIAFVPEDKCVGTRDGDACHSTVIK